MLDINDAADVIYQLKTKPFLCSDNLISTNDYIIVKKTGNITTDSIMSAIHKIKKRKVKMFHIHKWEKLESKPYDIYYDYSGFKVGIFRCRCRICGKIRNVKFW